MSFAYIREYRENRELNRLFDKFAAEALAEEKKRIRFWWHRHKHSRFFWAWAEALPKKLVYYAALRIGAHATTGVYSDTVVPELTFLDALQRWPSK
jgi:hypothetical protein